MLTQNKVPFAIPIYANEIYAFSRFSEATEAFWPLLFAKALDGVDVKGLITNIGSGAGSSAPAAAPAAAAAAPAAEAKKVETKAAPKKEEVKEASDADMGFGLFD